ncbi:MAG: amino acid ABC transporter permease [Ectothiorhodospiraceae bacterium]|nr:amino acid ABC transporter permease [Chromatiales bacterium]MCP5154164.1 amino acid ABC transporter permease [Ectothiorhodospiraceae bacterium]
MSAGRPGQRARWRPGAVDWLLLVGLAVFAGYVYYQLRHVLVYRWDWQSVLQFFAYRDEAGEWQQNLLLAGLEATLRIAIFSAILSLVLGLVLALMRVSSRLWPRMVARTYVELVRNTPPLVFLFIFYFFISAQLFPVLGIDRVIAALAESDSALVLWLLGDPRLVENLVVGILCLSCFEAAYVSEVLRAGIESVGKDQREGALAVGLTGTQTMWHVVLPQAVRIVIPALVGQLITLVKDTSIMSIISIQELAFSAQEVAVSTDRVFEVWILVALIYFVICYALSALSRRLELRRAVGR